MKYAYALLLLLSIIPFTDADTFPIARNVECYGSVQLNIFSHENVSYTMDNCVMDGRYWYCSCSNSDLNLTTFETSRFNILYSYYMKPYIEYDSAKNMSQSAIDIENDNNKRTKSIQLTATIYGNSSTYSVKETAGRLFIIGGVVFFIVILLVVMGLWFYFDSKKYEDIDEYTVNRFLEELKKKNNGGKRQ